MTPPQTCYDNVAERVILLEQRQRVFETYICAWYNVASRKHGKLAAIVGELAEGKCGIMQDLAEHARRFSQSRGHLSTLSKQIARLEGQLSTWASNSAIALPG